MNSRQLTNAGSMLLGKDVRQNSTWQWGGKTYLPDVRVMNRDEKSKVDGTERPLPRVYPRGVVHCGRTWARGRDGISKGPETPRHSFRRSYRRPGPLAAGQSIRCLGRQGQGQKTPIRIFLPSVTMPTRTSPSLNRPGQNTPGCPESSLMTTFSRTISSWLSIQREICRRRLAHCKDVARIRLRI